MTSPWRTVEPLDVESSAFLRRRAIFDCCKWDPQVGDVATIADCPLVLTRPAWCELTRLAELLAREIADAEVELVDRPELHGQLGLPRSVRKALGAWRDTPSPGLARLVRFDFHHTRDGWRISEANTDVPGGLNEASGLAGLMAPLYADTSPSGDPAGVYARALAGRALEHRHVALAHATAYTDDRQVMAYLARRLGECGITASLISPAHLRWENGQARIEAQWASGPLDAVVRFFPAEWLPNLPRDAGWTHFARGARTPVSNPATALLTQSKRLPLVWDKLRSPLATWRALLPETRDPRDAPWSGNDEWVVKPALGRVGEGVGVPRVTAAAEWTRIVREIRRHPSEWVAQRRFDSQPFRVQDIETHPSVGVYTVDGGAAGAYGRVALRPLIDSQARDTAVLVEDVA
jgi:glutathionylspermidine synthase